MIEHVPVPGNRFISRESGTFLLLGVTALWVVSMFERSGWMLTLEHSSGQIMYINVGYSNVV